MVFKCQICKTLVPPHVKATRIVLSTRVVRYPYRLKANRIRYINHAGKRKVRLVDDRGGVGREIAREIIVCPSCAERR